MISCIEANGFLYCPFKIQNPPACFEQQMDFRQVSFQEAILCL